MTTFRIYNGEARNVADKLFFGEDSGIRDWDDIKYPVMLDFNREMSNEFWVEDEVKLGKDIEEFRSKLSEAERYAYKMQTGALNWLDSIATDFNMLLAFMVTDSSVRSNIALINFFEVLHNRSYQYLTSSVLNGQEKKQAFEDVRKIPEMVHRNELILEPIEKMKEAMRRYIAKDLLPKEQQITESEVLQKVYEGIVAYMCLEGLYFSGGFVYFHSLARDQKMNGSNDLINLIKKDENIHSSFFGLLIQVLMREFPELATEKNAKYAQDIVKEAVKREKAWAKYIYQGIDTLSITEYHDYVEYLANLIFRNSGMNEPFPDNTELKAPWIVTYGSKKSSQGAEVVTREDFLQSNTIDYEHEDGSGFDL